MSGLEQIIDEPRLLEIAGEQLELRPLKVREIAPFSRAIKPLLPQLPNLLGDDVDQSMLVDLLVECDGLIDAVAIASRQPTSWVGDLDVDEFVLLALAVLEVNADFFARRLMPTIRGQVTGTPLARHSLSLAT